MVLYVLGLWDGSFIILLVFPYFFFILIFLSWFCKSDIWFATSYNVLFMAPKAFWILLVTSFRSQILSLFQLSKFLLKFIQKIHQKLLSENFSCLLGGNFAWKYLPWILKMVTFLFPRPPPPPTLPGDFLPSFVKLRWPQFLLFLACWSNVPYGSDFPLPEIIFWKISPFRF